MTSLELLDGDFVCGWWACVADDGTNMLVCLMKRRRWNFIFRLDNHEPGNVGVHEWVMQPTESETAESLKAKMEEALDAIFAESSYRRQAFIEVMSYNNDQAYEALALLEGLGFPSVRTSKGQTPEK